ALQPLQRAASAPSPEQGTRTPPQVQRVPDADVLVVSRHHGFASSSTTPSSGGAPETRGASGLDESLFAGMQQQVDAIPVATVEVVPARRAGAASPVQQRHDFAFLEEEDDVPVAEQVIVRRGGAGPPVFGNYSDPAGRGEQPHELRNPHPPQHWHYQQPLHQQQHQYFPPAHHQQHHVLPTLFESPSAEPQQREVDLLHLDEDAEVEQDRQEQPGGTTLVAASSATTSTPPSAATGSFWQEQLQQAPPHDQPSSSSAEEEPTSQAPRRPSSGDEDVGSGTGSDQSSKERMLSSL
ncbi:unnamed protein product, partial [Amoebophrya sp. A120]